MSSNPSETLIPTATDFYFANERYNTPFVLPTTKFNPPQPCFTSIVWNPHIALRLAFPLGLTRGIPRELCTSSYGNGDFSMLALSLNSSSTATIEWPASRLTGFPVYSYSIQVRWHSADTFTTGTSTSTLPNSTLPPTRNNSATPYLIAPNPDPNRLSPGLEAIIALAVILTLALIILSVFLFFRSRCRQSRNTRFEADPPSTNSHLQGLGIKSELEAADIHSKLTPNTHGTSELESMSILARPPWNDFLDSGAPLQNHNATTVPAPLSSDTVLKPLPDCAFGGPLVRKPISTSSLPLLILVVISAAHPTSTQPPNTPLPSPTANPQQQVLSTSQPPPPNTQETSEELVQAGNTIAASKSFEEEIERIRGERERLSRFTELGCTEGRLRQ
ncbi:hypothetical protein G7Y89_g10300 [Cudoniella acicularis]|uniref:Uncharacterized protein n=1 Tax=Cudoniella acicularis TaxID=354080 RepID=A0A8H4VZC6_9HELO|nr:hypothetical protein G7Y89_g10300 [Cudoniella acicularis]